MKAIIFNAAILASTAKAWSIWRPSGNVLYITTNNAENAIAAIPIGRDGTLSAGQLSYTGGSGANFVDMATGAIARPDALDSQSSLTMAGNYLFTVNAGSNSVSMLEISREDPLALTLVSQQGVSGEFPNTVAASAKNGLVCAGSTGSVAGVSCSSYSASGMSPMDALRPYDIGQSTPPKGPLNSVSHCLFNEDESMLLTMVKGDGMNYTGFMSAFEVQPGSVSYDDVRSSPAGTAVLFGTAKIPGTSKLFATDASFGAVILDVDSEGVATTLAKTVIPDQKASCWAVISPELNAAFVTDPVLNRIVAMSIDNAAILDIFELPADGDTGYIDTAIAWPWLYALSPGNGTQEAAIEVLDISGGPGGLKVVQRFGMGAMGVTGNAQGMAILSGW